MQRNSDSRPSASSHVSTYYTAPIVATWVATLRCNLNCIHCSSEAIRTNNELDTHQARVVIEQLIENDVFQLTISGGEPLLREDLFDLIKAYSSKIDILIQTNGLLVRSNLEHLASCGIRGVQISLDGRLAETHERIRGRGGIFREVVEAIRALVEVGVKVVISSVVTKINMNEIEQLVDFVYELGAQGYRTTKLIPLGNAAPNRDALFLSESEVLYVADVLARKALEYKQDGRDFVLDRAFHCVDIELSTQHFGCAAGVERIEVLPDGTVVPCAFLCGPEHYAGNIVEIDLKQIWNHSPVLSNLKNLTTPDHCRQCPVLPRCRGGCRATAYHYNGDIGGIDPIACQLHDKWN